MIHYKLFKSNTLIVFMALWFYNCQNQQVMTLQNSKGEEKTIEETRTFFQNLSDSLKIPGMSVAIINDSKVIYHETFGVTKFGTQDSISKNTLFEAASLSKPVFAYFVMSQVEKGILDLDKPLYQYLPYPDIEYDERHKSITARMILSHSSGFPNWRQDSLKIHFEPGSSFMYSGEGYKYLAHVMAKVNDVEFHQLDSIFQSDIVQNINAKRLYFKWNDDITQNKATGHINDQPTSNQRDNKDNDFGAAGGLHTEAYNYAKFMISIFENQNISTKMKDEMLREQIQLPETDINKIILGASGWSLGFGMIPNDHGMCYWHAGNNDDFQSWMHFYPDQKYGIVLFTNADKVQNPVFFDLFFGFMDDGISFDMSNLN